MECEHKCCLEAAKQKKSCEKCNPKPKKEEKKKELTSHEKVR
jgi:hypothetical protein